MNLNMQAFNINTLLGGLDKVRDVMGVYQQQLLLIVIVFALLNCFFGYALRKLWSVIPGFFLGAAAGYAAGTYTNQTTTITLALAVGTGLLTAIIAFVLYRIGLFLLICGLVGFCLWHLVNPNDTTGYGLVALVAFVIGLICVPFERISVILVTSICGALTTIRMAYFFKDLDLNMMFWIVSAILAAAGMLFQFKPWKEADYWEDDDEEEREHRAKARARRKRRSGFDPLPSRKKKKKRRGSSSSSSGNARDPYRSYQKPSNRTRVSQNTMYDFRFVPEEPDDDDDEKDLPKIIRRRPSANRPLRRSLTKKKHPQKLPWATRSRIPLLPNRRSPRTASRMSISPRSGSRFPKRYREFTKTIRTRNPHCSAENPAGKGTFPCLPGSFYPDFQL